MTSDTPKCSYYEGKTYGLSDCLREVSACPCCKGNGTHTQECRGYNTIDKITVDNICHSCLGSGWSELCDKHQDKEVGGID
ncbi:hypothetical protein LCGC14_0311200 [marine sediment metagenome]|uniref:Uncharacterized protein n=1 Tax=marine sediment metagenome TaxID=412755 RepID=A0A0F9U4W5_9ZZZZ